MPTKTTHKASDVPAEETPDVPEVPEETPDPQTVPDEPTGGQPVSSNWAEKGRKDPNTYPDPDNIPHTP